MKTVRFFGNHNVQHEDDVEYISWLLRMGGGCTVDDSNVMTGRYGNDRVDMQNKRYNKSAKMVNE